MLRVLLALAAGAGASCADAGTRDLSPPFDVASLMLLGAGPGVDASASYVMPAMTGFLELIGHSVVSAAGGMDGSRTTFVSLNPGVGLGGWGGWIFPLSGQAFVPDVSFQYGLGASTTAHAAGILTTTGNQCDFYSANTTSPCAQTEVQAKTLSTVSVGATSFTVGAPTFGAFTSGATYYVNATAPGEINFSCQAVVTGTASPYTVTLQGSPNTSGPTSQPCQVFGTIAVNAALVFVPPADTSNFASYTIPVAANVTNGTLDIDTVNNELSYGGYSPETDPAKIVFVQDGANDTAYPCVETTTPPGNACQTLTNLAAILDAFGPTQANKVVILSNERPYGAASAWSNSAGSSDGDPELHCVGETTVGSCTASTTAAAASTGGPWTGTATITLAADCPASVAGDTVTDGQRIVGVVSSCPTAGTTLTLVANTAISVANSDTLSFLSSDTVTLVNHTTLKDVQHVFYAPCGTKAYGTYAVGSPCGTSGSSTAAYAPGPNDGVEMTQVGSAPAQGQYSVNTSTGVLTFNAADQGARVAVFYRWLVNNTSDTLVRVRDWANSSSCSGSFQDELGYYWAINGAQCHRPWVKVADTWDAYCDPNACTVGVNGVATSAQILPVAGATNSDGDHPNVYGNHLNAKAMMTAAQSIGAIGSAVFPWPTSDVNIQPTATVGFNANTSSAPGSCASGTTAGPHTDDGRNQRLGAEPPERRFDGGDHVGDVVHQQRNRLGPDGQSGDVSDADPALGQPRLLDLGGNVGELPRRPGAEPEHADRRHQYRLPHPRRPDCGQRRRARAATGLPAGRMPRRDDQPNPLGSAYADGNRGRDAAKHGLDHVHAGRQSRKHDGQHAGRRRVGL